MSLVDQFFAEECDEHVRELLLREAERRQHGSRYFTFNRFNVRLDIDSASALIEDELDASASTTVSLGEFVERLRGGS